MARCPASSPDTTWFGHHQTGCLLLLALDRHRPHVRTSPRLADRRSQITAGPSPVQHLHNDTSRLSGATKSAKLTNWADGTTSAPISKLSSRFHQSPLARAHEPSAALGGRASSLERPRCRRDAANLADRLNVCFPSLATKEETGRYPPVSAAQGRGATWFTAARSITVQHPASRLHIGRLADLRYRTRCSRIGQTISPIRRFPVGGSRRFTCSQSP
jgi:hypothetical protein